MFKEVDYNKHYVVGTPLVGWKADKGEDVAWIYHGAQIKERFPNTVFFAALELDHRGLDPFQNVINRLESVGGTYWTFTINDHESTVTSGNRWIRIETARNLIREFAQRKRVMAEPYWGNDSGNNVVNFDAVLYVDSDIDLTPNIVEKLFEVDRPLVGVNVPEYALGGHVVSENPRIEEHWTTAGMLLVNAPAYYDLPWSHNAYMNLSDDPTFQNHARRITPFSGGEPYGMTWVRKDINAHHVGQLVPVEDRRIPNRQL